MERRILLMAAALMLPAVQTPPLEVFRTALKTYIDQTQTFRNEAASADGSEAAIRVRQRSLAEAIQTTVRPTAQQGDVLSPALADLIRRQLAEAFAGRKADIIRDGLQDQNEGIDSGSIEVMINQMIAVPRLPPVLLESLPQLPKQMEFAFTGTTLILRDVDADVVIDFIRQAFPAATR